MSKYSPGMEQFLRVKKDYEDYILFFRMGDFYEFFFDDAVIASRELEITLTSRSSKSNKEEDRIPMSGIPYHAAEGYIDILVGKGYKIAMCEQVEDPKLVKGLVKREVVQIITPGTIMQGKNLDAKVNNYLATVSGVDKDVYVLGYTDLSTGESLITRIYGDFKDVLGELSNLGIKEVVISEDFSSKYVSDMKESLDCLISYENDITLPESLSGTVSRLNDGVLKSVFSRLLNYLLRTQKRSLEHLQEVRYYESNQYMKLDVYSRRNLELIEGNRNKDKKGSLLWVLDKSVTAMGGRRLKQWLEKPLISEDDIENRLSIVGCLMDNYFERKELRSYLDNIYDLERLSGRVAFGNVNARDLIQLKKSLKSVPEVVNLINSFGNEELLDKVNGIDVCNDLHDLLEKSVIDEPPISIREGNIIKSDYNDVLRKYREAVNFDKEWVKDLERTEREETGIKNLKVNYNRAAGYFIEVPKNHIHLVPEGRYVRKQTLTNVERYITEDLKEKERLIVEAGEKIVGLEYDLFSEIRGIVSKFIPKLQVLSKVISEIDVLQSFAEVSESNNYVKPVISKDRNLIIKGGRHPVIEKYLVDTTYIKNDCYMDNERELLLITGPNMSGKSTYMRQVALASIMTQIGCYVSADYVELPIFDQIFTRIGAADDLVSGQSTFMVEMMETQNALKKSTENSLILLDEIGRGTSTYDGVAIAQAIIEYVHDNIGAKTFFSTHYHELTVLEDSLNRLKNIRVCVLEENDKIVFIHKVEEGAANKSYGIHVAELADLPEELTKRAKEILLELENDTERGNSNIKIRKEIVEVEKIVEVDKTSELDKGVLEMLKSLNILELSPMDSFNILNEIMLKLGGRK